jgi:hypothetical protein
VTRQRRRRAAAARKQPAAARRPFRRARAGRRMQRIVHRVVRRHPVVVVAALVLLHVALALLTFEPRPHTGGDNAAYITLARSLLERGAYLELWDPAEPPHTKYPPAFAGILAVAMAVGLQPWVQLKLVVLGFSAAPSPCPSSGCEPGPGPVSRSASASSSPSRPASCARAAGCSPTCRSGPSPCWPCSHSSGSDPGTGNDSPSPASRRCWPT